MIIKTINLENYNEVTELIRESFSQSEHGEVGRYRLVHITVTGLHHPLREPYVPLSEYTALLLFVRKNSLVFMNHVTMTMKAYNKSFTLFRYHCHFPFFFAFKIFDLIDMVNFIGSIFIRCST